MHRARFQTVGWAAFDRMQREKQRSGAEDAVDSFPTISNKTVSGLMESSDNVDYRENLLQIQSLQTGPFSSVVRPSTPIEFPLLISPTNLITLNIDINGNEYVDTVKSNANPVEVLKGVHSWADQHLIEDILAAVNNDVEQSSILLKEMVSSEMVSFGTSSSVMSNPTEDTDNFLEKSSFVDNKLSDNSQEKLIIKQLYLPTEPDWEEDDLYVSHRKEALKVMRAASQHSRAASNAYLRGDHSFAQQLSSRARKEWMTAEKLNAQAAEEILCFRNRNNGIWKLDLHGLHAIEAVHALKQHLQRIESRMMMNHFAASDELSKLETIQRSPSFDSLGGLQTSSVTKGNIVPEQRQTLLHVITGTGNHSKGQAALPAAVKSFLIDGGYRFDDTRPGVISVRPMFRYN